IISTSFADIFKNNALKNGILPIVVDASLHAQLMDVARSGDAAMASIDLATATLTTPSGASVKFVIDPFAQKMLLAGLDELDVVRSKEADIAAHERAHPGTINTKAPQVRQ
ncbi:MAG: 3-isopropylmalate dehydratase small subunit, partial [Candidatus Limnocylindrus sp.]